MTDEHYYKISHTMTIQILNFKLSFKIIHLPLYFPVVTVAASVQKNAVKTLNTLNLIDLFDQKLGSLKRHCLGLMNMTLNFRHGRTCSSETV